MLICQLVKVQYLKKVQNRKKVPLKHVVVQTLC